MSAFVEVGLVAAVNVARLMAGLLQLGNIRRRRAAVVGREDHEGVLRKTLLFQ